jgi:hypothetical protein
MSMEDRVVLFQGTLDLLILRETSQWEKFVRAMARVLRPA